MTNRLHNPPRSRRRPRGVAGLVAIILLLIVAATLAGVATAFSADAQRTRNLAAEAQLRQLLTAGAIAAAEQLKSPDLPTGETTVALPTDLNDRGATLKVSYLREGEGVLAAVDAALPPRRARQTVRFAQKDGRWSVQAVEMN
ncbi:MAG: hypothetical protein ABIP55_11630 [Tepidisphaeraceae bacterium]